MKYKNLIIKIFVAIFVCFLLYPNTGLFRGSKNVAMIAKENRKITPFPKESLSSKKFYTNFENWYQDRLRHRDKAIGYWRKIYFEMGIILKDNIFIGKNDWLFNKHNVIKNFRDAQIKADSIKKLQEYCKSKGKQFILMVPPTKESVYRDYFPMHEQRKAKEYYVWENQLRQLANTHKINYLSVTDELFAQRKVSENALYFNDDHHWSYYGSYIAVDVLLNKIKEQNNKLSDVKVVLDGSVRDAYKEWSYFGQLGFGRNTKTVAPWNKDFTDEIYVTDTHSGKTIKMNKVLSNDTLWGRIVRGEAIIENKKISNDITVLVLGDSYSSYMMPYLSQKISKIITTHYRDCAEKKKKVEIGRLLEQYNPDVVILEIVGNGFFHSKGDNNFKNMVF